MKLTSGLAAAAFSILALLASAPANAGDLYTVRGVHVDQTSKSATDARAIAQAQGQQLALGQLLKRLTLPEDWASLPQPDAKTAQDAVRGFQVASEKASATRYIADLNVSFQPDTVKRMLASRNIAYGETQAKPALLLAVLQKADGTRILWEDQNPWRDAWSKLDLANAMTPVIMPLGDVQEFSMVTPAQAISGDKAALSALVSRYGTDEVVVAYAVANADGTKVDVTVTRYGAATSTPMKRSYQGAADTVLVTAADGVLLALGDDWKHQIIVRGGEKASLTASAFYANLDQWEAIRKGLTSTPLVQGIQVEGIASGGAEIQIDYRGTPDKLALSLAQQNIALVQQEGGWSLRMK
ncbi:MAG: DUF2066 domain-containing protein [Parvibaculum sp.]|jgi:hypothetical protein|uniref:DUF2066 domain-containing protein n=1 Tax=Parvibaculum sp. TaxID=2024848 RepID=UPI002848FDFB|nr:DUF2066 domain-containing protein [Parvibaculum sp.]MDR3498121.1 DUF2066 domain-containing protein [Parvibaculum sp.]